jgi:tRNA-splicing ligase RtcB (3'-phosphate/5'-hydroxy nucleic acid ligase)
MENSLMQPENFTVMQAGNGKPIKLWTHGVPVGDEAKKQLQNIAQLPFIFKHVAVMPDVHLGKGSTIGSVISTLGAIIPAAVGVDIGCGMMAVRTSLTASDLPDNLHDWRSAIESAVPHGLSRSRGGRDKGSWENTSTRVDNEWAELLPEFEAICAKHKCLKNGDSTGHCNSAEIFCDGDKKFNVFLGRSFNSSAILSSCCCE